jgi:hypothetical protein
VNEELSLAAAFAIPVLLRVIPPPGLHDLPVDFVQVREVFVEGRIRQLCVPFRKGESETAAAMDSAVLTR